MTIDNEEVATFNQRGKAIYDAKLRVALDTPENRGKYLTIEPDSEDYEMGTDLLQIMNILRARNGDKLLYATRVGRETLGHLRGGRVVRK